MTADILQPLPHIKDVYTSHLNVYGDERGRFMETFRREWFPDTDWSRIQHNRSDSVAGVLRGLHYHFHQIDYWYVPAGIIRAGLIDLRPSSPTYMQSQTLLMGGEHNIGLYIPVGVAHGFYALADCTVMYVVNNYYTGKDEFGVAWDDPALNLDWQLDSAPLLSDRDSSNPRLADIPDDHMPL